ncbi:MAG: CBASS cGAMP-activated phospholipase [Hyphomicrobium sp.]|jgi:hypothetical protein
MAAPFRILSLDGGGVRGVYQATYLAKLKLNSGTISQAFDLIAGTSTGAIIALGLALDVPPSTLASKYREYAAEVFKKRPLAALRRGPQYDRERLKRFLDDVFGAKRLRDCLTKVVVPATSVDRFGHRVFSNLPGSDTDLDTSLVDVALASAAAPTYFAPVKPAAQERSYADGGLWASSPALAAALIVHHRYEIEFRNMRVLAIGTGQFPSGAHPSDARRLRPLSVAAVSYVLDLMFAAQLSASDELLRGLVGSDHLLRVDSVLQKYLALDDVRSAIEVLPPLAEAQAQATMEPVERLLAGAKWDRNKESSWTPAPRELIEAAGLTAFYPSRRYYQSHRAQATSIDLYVATAQQTLTMVSINLMTGVPFDDLCEAIREKLENRNAPFSAIISLLDPARDDLMTAIAPVFEGFTAQGLALSINNSLRRLRDFRASVSAQAAERLAIRVHRAIPFASAILIDHRTPTGRIQLETRPYRAPLKDSFGFEVARSAQDCLYESLASGFERLIKDGAAANTAPA